ncbi:MAG TPA: heme peroxidase family protein, partial [Pyrinomonadaceae bacterium]|nr:heme peroxidase family protein [Pyrinomonadaceae bacterium]
ESYATRDALVDLGMTMTESDHSAPDSLIPSIYTYFGQFVDHDITLEAKSDKVALLSSKTLRPLTLFEMKSNLVNGRKPGLDLDNVYYKPVARAYSRLLLGTVTRTGKPVARKDQLNDLPRRGADTEDKYDRAALIGDARNDENLIIAQLHVAFLRAHNAIAAQGHTFDEARKILRQHYQWIIVKDFLPRICDPWIVNSIVNAGNRWFRPDADDLFMPLEFSVAAYRFGHSMVRQRYHVNLNFPAATLADLFELTALSGTLKGEKTLPDAWVVEWENFVEGGANRARPIDTSLTPDLFNLMSFGKPVDPEARLPVRNLLRGYMLRLPTGQAVAEALQLQPLTAAEIEQAAQAVSSDQLNTVRVHGFSTRTPLWYYILAEAATRSYRGRLGPVGSTLVAEVLIGLVRGSKDSILRENNWQPWLGATPGEFQLSDLLKLAGVLNRPPGPTHQGEKL